MDHILPAGYFLAREIMIQLHLVKAGDKVRQTDFGRHASEAILNAVWRQDVGFLRDFTKGFQAAAGEYEPWTMPLYRFMLDHAPEISAMRSVTGIFDFVTKNPGLTEIDHSNFAKLCREIGLPVR